MAGVVVVGGGIGVISVAFGIPTVIFCLVAGQSPSSEVSNKSKYAFSIRAESDRILWQVKTFIGILNN